MKRVVWILNHYATGMLEDKGGRHYWIAKYLKRNGYEPVIFCSSVHHKRSDDNYIQKDLFREEIDIENNIPFVFVKTTSYKGNGLQRIKNMISFYINVKKVAKLYSKDNKCPDIIIGSSVHPLTIAAAISLSKWFNIECIGEIRDLWPESLVEYGIVKRNSIIHKILLFGEKWIYKKADKLVFTMEGCKDYIKEQGWDYICDKVYYINNGVDLEDFYNNKNSFKLYDKDLNNSELFKVVYTGSIRKVNSVMELVYVADYLDKKNFKNIKILIYGSGDQINIIRKEIEKRGLENIVLKGRVNKTYIPYILSKSDLNVYFLENSDLYRFGLSLNKTFEYFASGKPVLANRDSGYSIINKYKCGKCIEEYTPEKMADEIIEFMKMKKIDIEKYCKGSLEAAKNYDFKKLTNDLIDIIES